MPKQQAVLVTNLTEDDLGYAGFVAPASDTIIVPKKIGERMARANPEKFAIATPDTPHKNPRQAKAGTGERQLEAPLPFNIQELELSKG